MYDTGDGEELGVNPSFWKAFREKNGQVKESDLQVERVEVSR